jgi:hypothetical protein
MGEMGAHAQTGPLRSGIVGHAPEQRHNTHFRIQSTSILE